MCLYVFAETQGQPVLPPAPSIDIMQVFAKKPHNAEKQKKAATKEKLCCKNATVRSVVLNEW